MPGSFFVSRASKSRPPRRCHENGPQHAWLPADASRRPPAIWATSTMTKPGRELTRRLAGFELQIMDVRGQDLRQLSLDDASQPFPVRQLLFAAPLCAPENGLLPANLLAACDSHRRARDSGGESRFQRRSRSPAKPPVKTSWERLAVRFLRTSHCGFAHYYGIRWFISQRD